MYNFNYAPEVKKGDIIIAHGVGVVIDKVLDCQCFGDGSIDVEFFDDKGTYRHYRSWIDKGVIKYFDKLELSFNKKGGE